MGVPNKSLMSNPYKDYYQEKQRDLPQARQITEVPEWCRDRYATVEAYQEALADFLNGN